MILTNCAACAAPLAHDAHEMREVPDEILQCDMPEQPLAHRGHHDEEKSSSAAGRGTPTKNTRRPSPVAVEACGAKTLGASSAKTVLGRASRARMFVPRRYQTTTFGARCNLECTARRKVFLAFSLAR